VNTDYTLCNHCSQFLCATHRNDSSHLDWHQKEAIEGRRQLLILLVNP